MKLNSQALKIEMARKKMNGADLARMANVSLSMISLIVSGKRNPSLKMLGLIAEALCVDVTTLIEEE